MNRRGFLKGLGILIGSAAIPKIAISKQPEPPIERVVKKQRFWSYGKEESVIWYTPEQLRAKEAIELERKNWFAAKTTWKKVDGGWETE